MYDIIMSVYQWPSVIYTVYATPDSAEQITSFANQKDNIKVITAPAGDPRFHPATVNTVHSLGMLIFVCVPLYDVNVYTAA